MKASSVFSLLVLLGASLPVRAAEDGVERRLAELEARVKQLEQLVAAGERSASVANAAATEAKVIAVAIAEDGGISLAEQMIEPAALPAKLQGLAAEHPKPSLVIRASQRASYQKVAAFLQACSAAGLHQVAFASGN